MCIPYIKQNLKEALVFDQNLEESYLSEDTTKTSLPPQTEWRLAFQHYKTPQKTNNPILLKWTDGPCPGNYGDWLAPYIIQKLSGNPIKHIPEVVRINQKHLIAIGSIASVANKKSFVLGAGANSRKTHLSEAKYYSVRGPITAEIVLRDTKTLPTRLGDLGFILSLLYSPPSTPSRTKALFAPHINHLQWALNTNLPIELLDIRASHPNHIERIISRLTSADLVVTSAMHVLITCQSYGTPCILLDINKLTGDLIPGDGMKYIDAQQGIGLPGTAPIRLETMEEFQSCIATIDNIYPFPSSEALRDLHKTAREGIREYLHWTPV
jgi:hypothetical protein